MSEGRKKSLSCDHKAMLRLHYIISDWLKAVDYIPYSGYNYFEGINFHGWTSTKDFAEFIFVVV